METIYFFIFCVANAFIVFWCLRNDDQADFQGQKRDERFSLGKSRENDRPSVANTPADEN